MKTLRLNVGSNALFVLTEVAPELHDAVRGLYYQPVEAGFAKTFPRDTPQLDGIYQHFERHAADMVLQAAHRQAVDWPRALDALLQRLAGERIEWYLVGSVALALRGIDVQPHDLDLVVSDDEGGERLSELLADHLIEPVQRSPGWIWNSFGRAFLHARIEWVARVNPQADQPEPSDFGPAAAQRLENVGWRGADIRVPPLDLQLAVAQRRGLGERAELIRAFMNT